MCLPRELSFGEDGSLRIRPLRELESLRYDPVVIEDFAVESPDRMNGGFARKRAAELNGDAFEILVTVPRAEAERKYFGVRLFAGEDRQGLPINIQPANGTLRVGTAEAPFVVADLPGLIAGALLAFTLSLDDTDIDVQVAADSNNRSLEDLVEAAPPGTPDAWTRPAPPPPAPPGRGPPRRGP